MLMNPIVLLKRLVGQDDRPVCPSCRQRIDTDDETFFYRGLSLHRGCVGPSR